MYLSLAQVISEIIHYNYLFLFVATAIEGPIIMVVAGFMASLGYINLYVVLFVVVAGDLAGDSFYYAVGRYGRTIFSGIFSSYARSKTEKMNEVEKHFIENGAKTIIFGKLTQAIGGVILVAAGTAKMPFRKFIWYNFIATIPKALLLVLIGFYFGQAYNQINSYFKIIGAVSFGLTIALLIYFFYFYRKRN